MRAAGCRYTFPMDAPDTAPPDGHRPRPRGVYLLPNLFTTGGLFAGFYAIIAASQGLFPVACVAVLVAGVLDGIDGRVARLTNTQSEFGSQYDSLADLVSFGVAPAMVMYHWALEAMRQDGAIPGKIGWIAAFLYTACAALRLARFNSQIGQVDKRWFIGLASPAAALLMVSRLRWYSFKGGGSRSDRVPFLAILVVVAVVAAIAVDPPTVLFAIAALYALSGPVAWGWRRARGGRQDEAA